MAVPGAAIFAAEDSSSAVEDTAAEGMGEGDTEDNADAGQGGADEGVDGLTGNDVEAEPETEEPETEEPTPEQMVSVMAAYADDSASKLADTPADFSAKITELVFDKAVFGKYVDQLTDFTVNGMDRTSLYDCEMSVVDEAASLAKDESDDIIRAMKYAVVKEFEKVYGEEAFKAGRDVRRAIIAASGQDKDYEFAVSESVAAADSIYAAAGGITTVPADLLPEEPVEEKKALFEYVTGIADLEMDQGGTVPQPSLTYDTAYVASVTLDTSAVDVNTPGIYKITFLITGTDGSSMTVEKNCTVKTVETEAPVDPNPDPDPDPNPNPDPDPNPDPNPDENNKKLEDYVTNMADLEMEAGDSIPSVDVSYDTTYVASVTLNTSAVDPNTAGSYKIIYVITGVDGTIVNVEKTCVVNENREVVALRTQMCEAVDALGQDKFTEKQFQKKWEDTAASSKAQINTMKTKDEMQAVVDAAAKAADSILSEQQLYIAKQGYIKILTQYRDSFTYETSGQKSKAFDAAEGGINSINEAGTIEDASAAMETAKEKIRKIGEQDSSFIDELKADAAAKIEEERKQISDSTTIADRIQSTAKTRLASLTRAKEIESLSNTVSRAFADAKDGLGGNMGSMLKLLKDLKGLSPDSDTTSVISKVIGTGTPENLTDAENKVSDICTAITATVDEFNAYLTARAGKTIAGSTKAEAYAQYLKITNGTPDENLQDAKDKAKKQIRLRMNQITVSTEALRKQKEQLLNESEALVDAAASEDAVATALEQAMAKIETFAKEAADSEALKSTKEAAKKEIQDIVDAQAANTDLRTAVEKLAKTANGQIDAATSVDSISGIVENFKADVQLAIKQNEENEALTAVKVEYIAKLNSLPDGMKEEYITSEMNDILLKAKAKISEAKTADECASIYEQAKNDYRAASLVSMRKVYAAKIDALLTEDSFKNEETRKQAQEILDKQKSNLEQATNEETMQKCYELAQSSIEKLKEADANTTLTKIKADAITKLKNEYTNLTEQQAKVLNQYLNKINAATSEEEVNTLVAQCESAMQDAGAQKNPNGGGGGTTDNATDLAKAKADAISALTNMAATAPEANKEAAQTVLKEYTDKINAATTVDQVNQLKEEGIKALSKYGADSNAAKPNGNTTTTVGGSGNDASEKTSTPGTVKTGDENMGIIAAASAAFMAAVAAAVLSIRKFLKR